MSKHDALCPVDPPRTVGDGYCLWCEVIADVRAEVLADLRAKVEALLDPDTSGWAYQDAVMDVLDLLDGSRAAQIATDNPPGGE